MIFWDGYGLATPASGVFVHARHLGAALGELGCHPFVVAQPGVKALLPELSVRELKVHRLGQLKVFWPDHVAKATAREAADASKYVLHGLSNFNIPRSGSDPRRRLVVTVHDLIPLIARSGVSSALKLQMQYLMPRVLKHADRVICVSEWTKRTVLERFPFAGPKCVTIPNGAPPLANAQKKPQSGDPVLLYVARFEPYKRHHLLLEAVRRLKKPVKLVIVTDAAGAAALARAGHDLIQARRLELRSGLTPKALAELHAAAAVYVHPSLYEGFCLPAAEALAAGTPVVYQAGSATDAVAGRTVGFPVQSAAPEAWSEAIGKALTAGSAPGFAAAVANHAAGLPTWMDAARAVEALYGDILA